MFVDIPLRMLLITVVLYEGRRAPKIYNPIADQVTAVAVALLVCMVNDVELTAVIAAIVFGLLHVAETKNALTVNAAPHNVENV